ncbi:MAG: SusD/RagB family nutrient-binding outer membrane lipoprotein [Crocinitomicaceae bacterium]|nr:SusD/RagB family nutrient-binding outer membrane lipoprotein [Crocinitomicaceae bacterium]
MKKIVILIMVPMLFMMISCEKYFGDINQDPNNPTEVTPEVILPGIQATMSYSFGGDGARFSTILSQHIKGVSRQWAVIEQYTFIGEDVNTLFGVNLYADVLMELNNLKRLATENEFNHYNGVAKVLEAQTLLFIADFWDSSPYSEAFQGLENLQPAYDSQSELYATIFQLLQSAREDFAKPGGVSVPGGDDLYYTGDIGSWIGLSNYIEAKANLRLAVNDNTKYQEALNAITAGGLIGDMSYPYSGGVNSNPMYQFNEQRGDCTIGTKISEMLTALNDPRTALYNQPFDAANTYITASMSHKIETLVEQKFIETECVFNISGAAAAHPLYLEAIQMALQAEGIVQSDIDNYIAQAEVDPGSGSLTLEHIINQKYLALFLDHETYTDWRRTGFPTLTPNVGSQIPLRFPVSQRELNLNAGNASYVTIYTPVSWDN